MTIEFWGRSAHHEKLLSENSDAVKYGNGKEMTQPVLNYETCVELRDIGFDETAALTGARFWTA